MRRWILIITVCFVLLGTAFAQKGRVPVTGQVCGDGEAYSKDYAEFLAWQAAEQTCWNLGGAARDTHIIYSGCGLLSCRATACTHCNIY